MAPNLSLRRSVISVFFVFVTVAVMVFGASPAMAQDPGSIGLGQIVDEVDALGDDKAEVTQKLNELKRDYGIELRLVFVANFSGRDGDNWADAVWYGQKLDSNAILVAVATEDRKYGSATASSGFPLRDETVDTAIIEDLVPHLSGQHWAQAAIAFADRLRIEQEQAERRPIMLGIGVGVLLIGGVIVTIIVLARRRLRENAELAKLGTQAGQSILEIDKALQFATEELGFGEAEFAQSDVAPFADAIKEATLRARPLLEAYNSLTDSSSRQARRQVFDQVIRESDALQKQLSEHAGRVQRMREMAANPSEALAQLRSQIGINRGELPELENLQSGMTQRFIGESVMQLGARLVEVREQVAQSDQKANEVESRIAAGETGHQVVGGLMAIERHISNGRAAAKKMKLSARALEKKESTVKAKLQELSGQAGQWEKTIAVLPKTTAGAQLYAAIGQAREFVQTATPTGPYDLASKEADIERAFNRFSTAAAEVQREIDQRKAAEQRARMERNQRNSWRGGGFGGGFSGRGSSGRSFGPRSGGGSFGPRSGGGRFGSRSGGGRF